MIALAVEDRADLQRWLVSGAIVLCAYGAIAGSLLLGAPPPDESAQGAAIVIELAEMPVASTDVTPTAPETPQEQPEEKPEEKIEGDVAMLPPETKPEPPKVVQEDAPPPTPTTARTEGRQDTNATNLLPKWQKEISTILERNKRYPSEARAKRQQGIAKIAFNMNREGKVLSTRLVTSSGSSLLDEEALSLTHRAQFPPPPVVFAGGEITVTVPIRFSLR